MENKRGSRLLDAFSKLTTDTLGIAQAAQEEMCAIVKSYCERFLTEMDFVTREEFDAVRTLALRAREENDVLTARLAALESRLETLLQEKKETDENS